MPAWGLAAFSVRFSGFPDPGGGWAGVLPSWACASTSVVTSEGTAAMNPTGCLTPDTNPPPFAHARGRSQALRRRLLTFQEWGFPPPPWARGSPALARPCQQALLKGSPPPASGPKSCLAPSRSEAQPGGHSMSSTRTPTLSSAPRARTEDQGSLLRR